MEYSTGEVYEGTIYHQNLFSTSEAVQGFSCAIITIHQKVLSALATCSRWQAPSARKHNITSRLPVGPATHTTPRDEKRETNPAHPGVLHNITVTGHTEKHPAPCIQTLSGVLRALAGT